MTVLTTQATYSGGVFRPATKVDLPEGAAVELRISTVLPIRRSIPRMRS